MWHNQFFGHFVNISVVNYDESADMKVFLPIQKLNSSRNYIRQVRKVFVASAAALSCLSLFEDV